LAAIQATKTSSVFALPGGNSEQAHQTSSSQTPYVLMAVRQDDKLLATNESGDLRLINPEDGQSTVLVTAPNSGSSLKSCREKYIVFDRIINGKPELWRANIDGSNLTKLLPFAFNVDCPSDGKWLYFWPQGNKVYRVPLEGGTPTEIVTLPSVDVGGLAVSRDGTQIAIGYQQLEGTPQLKLGVAPASGGELRFVAKTPFRARGLSWAPSGKAVNYILTRDGATNIWEQPIDGSAPRQVTHFTSGMIFHYAWSHDGKTLLVERGSESQDVILMSNFRQ